MEVIQEPGDDPSPVQEHGNLLVLALLAFAVGGLSGLVGSVFRLVLEQSDRFRNAVIDWAHGKELGGFALVIGIPARGTSSKRVKIYCSVLYAILTRQLVTDWSWR